MVTGGNKLGDLTVGIRAPLGTFRQDLTQAEGAATQTSGRIGNAFSNAQSKIQGAARQVPVFGDALANLATPTGAATLAFGGLSAAVIGSVQKIITLEAELRPMIARSGLAAESLQVLSIAAERLGSEDGLEGVTDSVQELQLRLAEAVQDGTGPAVAAFEKLGLAAEDLIEKSPEEMFRAVITALQNLNNEADKKFLADELLGGSSEKLAGIIALEAAAFANLTDEIRQNYAIASQEALDETAELAIEMEELGQKVDQAQLSIGLGVIPVLNDLVDIFDQPIIPESQKQGFSDLTSAAENWVLVGNDQVIPGLRDLGEGFEDMASTALAETTRAFDPETPGSFPHTYFEGFTHVVQVNQQLVTEMGRTQNTLAMMQVQANRDRISRAEELAARRLAIRQQGNEDVEEEDTEHFEDLTQIHEAAYANLNAAQDGYEAASEMSTADWVAASLQAHEDAQGRLLESQLASYGQQQAAQQNHFAVMTAQVDSFIRSLPSSSGYTPSTLFQKNRGVGPDGVRTKDLSELEDTSYGFRVKRDSAGEYYKFHSGYWVHEDDYNDFATWIEKQGEDRTGGGRGPSSGGMSDFSLSYDSQGNYVGAGRGTHDITGNDANNQKTGVNASSRENLGLAPVGSTPPTLPGLPGFADGGIAMRPMAANIAESGPEAIIPLQKVGGTTINVIFGEGAVLANDAVEFVLDALHEADLRGFR